ncbi:MAG: thymidylate synthase [Nanoarchaeota archaeon]
MDVVEQGTMKAWIAGLSAIQRYGVDFVDKDTRTCKEVLNLVVRINDAHKDVLEPISYLTQLNLWIYPTVEELQAIIFARKTIPTIQFTYGSRIFNFQEKIDQIHDFIIPLLKSDPTSRRAVLTIFDPVKDAQIYNKEVPGLVSIYFKMHEGKLTVTGTLRSNDYFIGWPTNVFQIYKLQEYVAHEIGVSPGELITISHSAHFFEEYTELIDDLLKRQA